MPEFAQFIALSDDYLTLTGGESWPFTFDLPDLDLKRTVILMFKVSGQSGVRLLMTRRDPAASTTLIDFTLDSTFATPRSWHEIVPKNVFRVTDNELVVDNPETPSVGKVTVSDIVVLYHAKTL
jgi:hypothetical protein